MDVVLEDISGGVLCVRTGASETSLEIKLLCKKTLKSTQKRSKTDLGLGFWFQLQLPKCMPQLLE